MKKTFSILLALVMVLGVLAIIPAASSAVVTDPAATGVESGTTGDCTWTLDDDGTLTISGDGKVTILDATSIQRFLAGLPTHEGVGTAEKIIL